MNGVMNDLKKIDDLKWTDAVDNLKEIISLFKKTDSSNIEQNRLQILELCRQ
jgi:hypothetical protein